MIRKTKRKPSEGNPALMWAVVISAVIHAAVVFLLPAVNIFPPAPEYVELETILFEDERVAEPGAAESEAPAHDASELPPFYENPTRSEIIEPAMVGAQTDRPEWQPAIPAALHILPDHLEHAGTVEHTPIHEPLDDALTLVQTLMPADEVVKEPPPPVSPERLQQGRMSPPDDASAPAEQYDDDMIRVQPQETVRAREPEFVRADPLQAQPARPKEPLWTVPLARAVDAQLPPVVLNREIQPDAPRQRESPPLRLPERRPAPDVAEDESIERADESVYPPGRTSPERLPRPDELALPPSDSLTRPGQASTAAYRASSRSAKIAQDAAWADPLPQHALHLPERERKSAAHAAYAANKTLPDVQEFVRGVVPEQSARPAETITDTTGREDRLLLAAMRVQADTLTARERETRPPAHSIARIAPQPERDLPAPAVLSTDSRLPARPSPSLPDKPRVPTEDYAIPERPTGQPNPPEQAGAAQAAQISPRSLGRTRDLAPATSGHTEHISRITPQRRTFIIGSQTVGSTEATASPLLGILVRKDSVVPQVAAPEATLPDDDVLERIEPADRDADRAASQIEGPAAGREVISKPDTLPELAIEMEVSIRLRFWVLPDGSVGEVVPLQRGDIRLEQAAIQYLKSWRFTPVEPGSPQVWGIIPISYKLQ